MKTKVTPASPMLLLDAISDMLDAAKECNQFEQSEITKRKHSSNQRDIEIAAIHAKRDVLLKALENDHDLNKDKINKSFSIIDTALESGDLKMLELGLSGMLKVAESSPLVQLQELLKDENNVIDI